MAVINMIFNLMALG